MVVSTGKFGTLIGFDAHQDGEVKKINNEQVVYSVCHQGRGCIVLILTRRVGEKIVIGENVTVTVLSVKGNQVRTGIDAPRDVTVNREEIYQRILKEQKSVKKNNWVRIPAPTVQAPTLTLLPSDKR